MFFGQVVIGPPGSGKTTYCSAMTAFLTALRRKVSIINLDPANENMTTPPRIDVAELIEVRQVMETMSLGPNGALMFCMEYLEKNFDWLEKKLDEVLGDYLIFDCPGQVELFTHHTSLRIILEKLQRKGLRLACVHLVDSHYCTDPAKYMSALLVCLQAMINLEMPFVNVLSKIDLIGRYEDLAFSLDFYTEVQDLDRLVDCLDENAVSKRYASLSHAIAELIRDFSLLEFTTLNVQDSSSMLTCLRIIDKATGYTYVDKDAPDMVASFASNPVNYYGDISEVQEKYLDPPLPNLNE